MARAICGRARVTARATVASSALIRVAISRGDFWSRSWAASFDCSVRRRRGVGGFDFKAGLSGCCGKFIVTAGELRDRLAEKSLDRGESGGMPRRSLRVLVFSGCIQGFDYGVVELGADALYSVVGAVGPGVVGQEGDWELAGGGDPEGSAGADEAYEVERGIIVSGLRWRTCRI